MSRVGIDKLFVIDIDLEKANYIGIGTWKRFWGVDDENLRLKDQLIYPTRYKKAMIV